jgi:predicted metal-dependent hydrolase
MARRFCALSYGSTTISYELSYSKRRSLEIAVHPDRTVVVKAPEGIDPGVIDTRVKRRARWIKRQIRYFAQFEPRTPKRMYIGGESHLYLGRHYRLKLEKSGFNQVLLKNGYFYIHTTDFASGHIAQLMDKWYRERAAHYFARVLDQCWEEFRQNDVLDPGIKIMRMKKRWGSLTQTGILTLNLDLIKTPKECIEYVVVHELCHLLHHNHGPGFYQLLDRLLPDWVKRKHKLEMTLV